MSKKRNKKTKKKVYRNRVQFYKDKSFDEASKILGRKPHYSIQCHRWRTFGANYEKTGASCQAFVSKGIARENAMLVMEELVSWYMKIRITRDDITDNLAYLNEIRHT